MSTARNSTSNEQPSVTKRLSAANKVLLLIVTILLAITLYKYNTVQSLREFQERQDVQVDRIKGACDWMRSKTAKYTGDYNNQACEGALNEGESVGVVGQICEIPYYLRTATLDYGNDELDFLYQRELNAEPPSEAEDGCELATDKLERLKADAYIIPACNSVEKLDSQGCKNAQAIFNGKFKAVLCYNNFTKSFTAYAVYSKDIYDNKWHYTYNGLDLHANEECTW